MRAPGEMSILQTLVRRTFGVLAAAWLISPYGLAFTPEKSTFAVRLGGDVSPYRVTSAFVLPGESLELSILGPVSIEPFEVEAGLPVDWLGEGRFRITAPSTPGIHSIDLRRIQTGETVLVNLVVMVPAANLAAGQLDGYRVGEYPREPLKGLPQYEAPVGFIRVLPEMRDLQLSPHFRLGQFLCKQEGSWPRYLVLRTRLLLKLETLLEEVNRRGVVADTFFVMSGYRTPSYNRAIGNRTTYSRHLYGDAADIFIDERPRDERMDDLNGDGRVDHHDMHLLADIVEDLDADPDHEHYVGGLGRYRANRHRGPFVHVDTRGFRARW